MPAKKKSATSMLQGLEAEHDKLLKQRVKIRAEIARTTERQHRLLTMLTQFPEVSAALKAGLRPTNIDAETWADLQSFVAGR